MNKWTEANDSHLYFQEHNGRIIGQAHRLGVSGPWYIAKVCEHLSVDFTPIGNYIDLISAKNAVEVFWELQNNTINENTGKLVTTNNRA
jgi:hypothetical protein